MNLTLRKPKSPPRADALPMVVMPDALEPLGEVRGRRYFRHRDGWEALYRRGKLTDLDPLPAMVLVTLYGEDGNRTYDAYEPVPAGTYASAVEQAARPAKARPIRRRAFDALAELTPRNSPMAMPGTPTPEPSPQAQLEELGRRGVSVELSGDREYLLMVADRAIPATAVLGVPLWLAFMRGEPLGCAWPHTGEAPQAATLAVGGAPICIEHLRGQP